MMHNGSCYIVAPKEMKRKDKLELAQKVYTEAHQIVFIGVSFSEFYDSVFNAPTLQTKIMIYTANDKVLGYATFQLYQIKKCKVKLYVPMTEVCLRKQLEEHWVHPTQFFVHEVWKFLLHHPFANIFMVDTLLSPQIYKKLCGIAYEVYPKYNRAIPFRLARICNFVAKQLHWKYVTKNDCIIRSLQWRVKDETLLPHKKSINDLDKKFFSKTIKNFKAGKGLVIIAPITFYNMVMTLLKTGIYYIHYELNGFKIACKKFWLDLSMNLHKHGLH